MFRVIAVLFSVWLLAIPMQAHALNESQFQTLDIRDGLPSQQINSMAQDRDGHIWLASKDGLARYDGRRFRVYRHNPGDASSLPANYIGVVHVDQRNQVWVAVEGHGVFRLNADQEGFSAVPLAGQSRGLDIWSMVSDASGSLWFGSFGQGLFRRLPDGQIQHFMPKSDTPGLPDENVLTLAIGSDQTLWIGTSSGLALWRNNRFVAFDSSRLPSKVVLNIIPDIEYGIWLSTQAGLVLLERSGVLSQPAWHSALSLSSVVSVLRESPGVRWFVTAKGLSRVENNQVQTLYDQKTFISALQDQQGGFWFGSDQGLIRQPKTWRYFNAFSYQANSNGLRSFRPTDFTVRTDGSLLLVGSNAAVDQFWPETGQAQPFVFKRDAIKSNEFRAVLQDQQGRVWLGGDLELLRVDGPDATPRIWHKDSASDAGLLGPVRDLLQTGDGRIWVSYYGGGLQMRSPDGRVLLNITPKSGHGMQYPDPEQIFNGPDGQIWLVGGEGLLRWDSALARLLRVPGPPITRLFSAHMAANNTLWIGGMGQLESYRWHADSQSLQRLHSYSGDDGLPAVEISGIAFDAQNDAWLSTSRGLLRFDIKQRRSRLFGINDGLISQEFDVRAPWINANGLAVALSKRAAVTFRPEAMRASLAPLNLVLEQITVRRQEDQVALMRAGTIIMQPNDRDLSIEAQLLNFDDVSAHRYRSRLSNFDPDWIEMGNSGTRVFSKLNAGRYRLQIIASNAEGLWSAPRTVEIQVLPPWWKTGWAMAAYALVLLCAVVLLLAGNRRRLKYKHEEQLRRQQQQMLLRSSEAKSQFLANLGHEIRTPMTGVLGMTELLLAGNLPDKPKAQVQSIQKAGEHLLRLMNDALDLSKIEAGQFILDNQAFDVRVLLQEVQGLLAPLAAHKGLHFELCWLPGVQAAYHGDGGRIRQILYNLGNNAIKFTANGHVHIQIAPLQPQGIQLTVIDSGPGMSDEQQAKLFQRFVQADGVRTAQQYGGSGLGLAISKELANLMGGDLSVHSVLGQGSAFTVTLPLAVAQLPVIPVAQAEPLPQMQTARILLVEDDDTIVAVISQLLGAQGHQVAVACNALEALSQTAQKSFDVIFCDVDLPGMSGLDLTRIWRQQGLATAIVALTARTQADDEAHCLAAGMSGFLRKPVSGAQLQQALLAAQLN